MKWMLVAILVAPAPQAQDAHSRVYETMFETRENCMAARTELRKQYMVHVGGMGQVGKEVFDGSLANIACVPKPDNSYTIKGTEQ